MNAIAPRQHDEDSFVGQILVRSSPVLTWRPALVAHLEQQTKGTRAPQAKDAHRGPMESSVRVSRMSRNPTRRMVAWPVVRKVVHHSRGEHVKTIALRAVTAIVAGSLLGVLVLFALRPVIDARLASPATTAASVAHATGATAAAAAVRASSAKVAPVHVLDESVDSLAPSPSDIAAAIAMATPPPKRATPAPPAVTAPAHVAPRAAHAKRPARHAHR